MLTYIIESMHFRPLVPSFHQRTFLLLHPKGFVNTWSGRACLLVGTCKFSKNIFQVFAERCSSSVLVPRYPNHNLGRKHAYDNPFDFCPELV